MQQTPSQGSRTHRWMRAAVPLGLVAILGCSTVACTAEQAGGKPVGSDPPGISSSASSPSSAVRQTARLNDTDTPAAVVPDGDPGEVSLALSRALFAAAPVVVVAQTGDGAGIKAGTSQATRLGVPLLLADTDGAAPEASASGTTKPSGTATAGRSPAGAPSPALAAEVKRLGAQTVLTTSVSLADRLGKLPDVRLVTDPDEVGDVSPTHPASDLTVLVRRGQKLSQSAAATASAAAAGARVVTVAGHDVRADPEAIEALAEQPPSRVLAVGDAFGPVKRLTNRLRVAETGVQLPGGGQTLFPGRRLVALYGHPGTAGLGVLGEQGLDASISRAKKLASEYDSLSKEPVVPAFEIIATTAQSDPGPDGDFSGEASVESMRPWVEKARQEGVYVVLDLQPGRADCLEQAKRYEELLRQPNVGLAIDPEWKLGPGQQPLNQIGGVDAKEINSVTEWLADLTAKAKLPQKLLVLHQFRLSMIRNEDRLDVDRDEVQVLVHMDGQGGPELKDATWRAVTHAAPKGMPFGWKNFYDEDQPMATPKQTMAKKPTPFMISYQ